MQRLAVRVPRSLMHLIRFDGVLDLNATLRAAIEPVVVQPMSGSAYGQAARALSRGHAA